MSNIQEKLTPVYLFIVVAGMMIFGAGASAGTGNVVGTVINFVLAGVVLYVSYRVHKFLLSEALDERDEERRAKKKELENALRELKEAVGDILPGSDGIRQHMLEHAFFEAVNEASPGDNEDPTLEEIEKARVLFHEKTGHHVRVTRKGSGYEVVYSDKAFPLASKKTSQPTPKKPGHKAGKVKVTDKKVAPKKPLNKVK